MNKNYKLKINKPNLKLKLACNKDIKFTFELYNENVLENKFFTRKQINFFDHSKWFENKIREKFFFICSTDKKIGYIRFDKIKKKNLSVSIAVKKQYQRRGYGQNMLIKALKKNKISQQNVWAIVKNKNLTSKKFFLKLGFKYMGNNRFMKRAKMIN